MVEAFIVREETEVLTKICEKDMRVIMKNTSAMLFSI